MDTTRWQHLESLFHELAELPPGSVREAALAARCGDDAALAAEVRALLANDARLDGADGVTDPHLGLRLGAYEVTALIARGGMAAVYEARRADESFEQRVAIKVMDLRLSDPALVAQFRAERQILAALEHPSLTRLLDGGVTPLGEPYLVMEYVEGQPIDRYCDAHRLEVPARLRLFADVCDGVAFAHRTLVLHRDLKPSNILVTAEGRVKVVDFGTATLLQPDRLATMSPAPLTPAYASPEQLTGGPVGTASDQYSLGLVLFELLTGASAFGERTSLMAAVERALAATTTTAPHAAVTDVAAAARQTSLAKLRRTLSGDLATILGKALAHAPGARYASVQHFADDLQRWAAGEPILGRAPTLAYQASRFVRRHWISTSIAATLALALVITSVMSLQQAAAAREQARIAQTESGKARQLNRFLTEMLSSANPMWQNSSGSRAGSITVRDVLDGATQTIGGELGGTPAVEAEMRRTLATTYIGIGATDQADVHLDRALELYASLDDASGLATAQDLKGTNLTRRGHAAEAERLLRQAAAYTRSPAAAGEYELRMAVANDLALAISNQRPLDPETIPLLHEALTLADRHSKNRRASIIALHNLGQRYGLLGDLDNGERHLRDGLRRADALGATALYERTVVLRSLAELLRAKGDYPEALSRAEEGMANATKLFPLEHPFRPYFHHTLGRALAATGDLTRAESMLRTADTLMTRLRPAGHSDLALARLGLGHVYRRRGQLPAAERVLREARTLAASNPGLTALAADVAGELGLTLRARGAGAEAEALMVQSYEALQRSFGDAHPQTRRALARLGGATD